MSYNPNNPNGQATSANSAPVVIASNQSALRIADGTGNLLTSLADGAGSTGLSVAMTATNFIVSAANSTTAQLATTATFTGTIETIFNQQAISILVTTDQNGTLILNQYIDLAGTRKISAWTYTIVAGVPFSRCFVGNGNYFNLTFQNTSGSTTTTLNINTAYGTLPAASNLGNAPVSLDEVNGTAFSLGQKVSASSLPVVLASDQSPVPITGSQVAPTTVSWTSATTVNTASSISVTNLNTVSVTMSNTSTMTGGVLTFEVSPDSGTTWFAIAMARIDSYTVETTYTLSTVANRAWTSSVDAFTNFRVRLSTIIVGTGTATIKVAAQLFAIEPIITVGQATAASLQTTAAIASIAAGANLIGKVNVTTQTTGGATSFTLISAATTNGTNVKASAGVLYMLTATNNSATVAFLKMYNLSTAPTVGSSSVVLTFMIPANGGVMVPIPPTGITFSTGIAYALTGLPAGNDSTAVALNQIQLNGAYA
ncbi:MAG TPA: hypothetical protein VIM31_00440 [Candidatus Microsaccharimonas sp.]|jgi:hypothetical protein